MILEKALTLELAQFEDNLYLSTLYDYLETPAAAPGGTTTRGPEPADGVYARLFTLQARGYR